MTKARAETLATPTMRRALSDPALLGNVLAGESWRPWKVLLIALWGEALDDDERVIFTNLTCRAREPLERCEEFWAIAGRRAGKSRAIAVLIVFLACFVNYSAAIAVGERLIVLCLAQNAKQAAVVFGYVAGIIESVPLLAGLVKSRTSDVLSLTNGLDIEIRAASFRGLRGVTSAAVVADEICIWRDEGSGSTNVDKEILEACRPSLATTRGPLIAIGSPYARRGEAYQTWARHYGPNGDPKILIAQGASRDFNESLPQSVVERAMERDPAWAAAEYLGQWRNDVETFVSRDVIEAAVDRGLVVRPPRPSAKYVGYVDAASGAGRDSFCTAIVHCEGDIVVLDAIVEQRPPFNPSEAARDAAALLKSYKITECRGDKYAAGFVVEAFGRHGVQYRYCDNDTSTNYLEALPMLNAGRVRLVDDRRLVEQFCGLERKTSTSGRDRVDHGGADRHDDLAAATAGAIVLAASRAASPGMLEFYKWLVRGEAPDSPLGEPQVRVRAPPHVSHLRTLSGLELAVPADRVLELAESDAKPLIGLAGWTRA